MSKPYTLQVTRHNLETILCGYRIARMSFKDVITKDDMLLVKDIRRVLNERKNK